MPQSLQVVIIKPSKYLADGFVERFRRGFMPNSTVPYMRSMVPVEVNGMPVETQTVDEYVHNDLENLHPSLSRKRLSEFLFECYRKFFSWRHALQNFRKQEFPNARGSLAEKMSNFAMSLFVRHCAWRQTHPMSGGVMRVRLDGVDDFLSLRKRTFGFELAPLPRSLQLPAAELQTNQVLARPVAR